MIILHENLPKEAAIVDEALKQVYGFSNTIVADMVCDKFPKIPQFNGYSTDSCEALKYLHEKYGTKRVIIVTNKDFYFDVNDKDEDWAFGFSDGQLSLVSVLRLKGTTGEPLHELQIPFETYKKRISYMAVHEVGHGVITESKSYKPAHWVNIQKGGYKVPLGPHCGNKACSMYQTLDITAPDKSVGYLLLGDEQRYDSGLDETIARILPGGLCKECRDNVNVTDEYIK